MHNSLKAKKVIAYHEAGHCVSACLVHIRFKFVSIIPDEMAYGKCRLTAWKNFDKLDMGHLPHSRIKKLIFNSLAGPVAEQKLTKSKRMPSSFNDYEQAFDMAATLCGGNMEETNAYINFMWEQTKIIITWEENWEAVEAVAETLLERQILKYKEARNLIKEVVGEVIPPLDLL